MQLLNYNLEAHITFEAESIEKILALCEEAIYNITSDHKARFKLKCVIHELIVNSLEHGYNKSSGKVGVTFRRGKDSVFFEVCDEGSGLNPSSLQNVQQVDAIENAPSRGWGLVIINEFAQDLRITPNTPSGTKISLSIPAKS